MRYRPLLFLAGEDGLQIPVTVQSAGDLGAGAAAGIDKVTQSTKAATEAAREYKQAAAEANAVPPPQPPPAPEPGPAPGDDEESEGGEQHHIHGRGGHLGHLLENFGVSRDASVAIGMSVLAASEIVRLIGEAAAKTQERANREREVTDEINKQVLELRELAQSANNAGDVGKIGEQMGKGLDDLQAKIQAIKTAPDGVMETLKKGAGLWEESLADVGSSLARRMGLPETENPINKWMQEHTKTQGEEDQADGEKRIEVLRRQYETEYRQAQDHRKEMERVHALPLDQQASYFDSQIAAHERVQDAQDLRTMEGIKRASQEERQIQELRRELERVQQEEEKAASAAQHRREEFEQVNQSDKTTDPEKRLAQIKDHTEQLKSQLSESLGQSVNSPEEVFDLSPALGKNREQIEQGAIAWAKLNNEADKTQKEIEGDEKWWNDMLEETGEYFDKMEAVKGEIATQREILNALLQGDKGRAQELGRQLELERQIKQLKQEGAPDALINEVKVTAELQKQLDLKERAAKIKDIDQADKIEHDKATHNRTAQARDERAQFEEQRRKRLGDAGLTGDDLNDRLKNEMHDYDRIHRHTIGGPTTHADNDDLGRNPTDFDKEFHRPVGGPGALDNRRSPGGLGPTHGGAPLSPDNNIPDNLGTAASKDFDSLNAMEAKGLGAGGFYPKKESDGGSHDKGGGDGGMQEAAQSVHQAGTDSSAAAKALKDGSGKLTEGANLFKEVGSSISQLGSTITGTLQDMKQQIDQLAQQIADVANSG